jgi:hypothetical protein
MLRPFDPEHPVVATEKTSQVQAVGTAKKTLGKIVVNMNPEEQYKSKIEFFLKYGNNLSKVPLRMNFGIRSLMINPELSDLANINRWFDVVDKTKVVMSAYAQRILECYDSSTSRKLADEYLQYSYSVSCRRMVEDVENFVGKKYSVQLGDSTYYYYDSNPLEDNNNDLEATKEDMTDKLYNFVSAVFNKLAEHIEINGEVEGFMYLGWDKEYTDKKTNQKVQYLNPIMTPDSFLLPTKSKTNDKIYYNSGYDCQFLFQSQPHVIENEVGFIQGLIENPDKYQLKCKIATRSNVELDLSSVSEKDAANDEPTNLVPLKDENGDSLPF